jgi:hypothetical protein
MLPMKSFLATGRIPVPTFFPEKLYPSFVGKVTGSGRPGSVDTVFI